MRRLLRLLLLALPWPLAPYLVADAAVIVRSPHHVIAWHAMLRGHGSNPQPEPEALFRRHDEAVDGLAAQLGAGVGGALGVEAAETGAVDLPPAFLHGVRHRRVASEQLAGPALHGGQRALRLIDRAVGPDLDFEPTRGAGAQRGASGGRLQGRNTLQRLRRGFQRRGLSL